MPPPQLAGNAPVLNVAHPGKIKVFVLLRHKFDVAIFHGFDGWFGEFLGVDVPLVGQPRLDNHAGTVAARDF